MLAEAPESRVVGARLQGWAIGNCVYYQQFSLVRLTGGSSTRVVGDCSTSTRAAEFPGAFDVDEGVEGRCRVGLRASWIISSLATHRIGTVTGMGITQRGGDRSRA